MKSVKDINLKKSKLEFMSRKLENEDDIKINFYSDIIQPILKTVNPKSINQFSSEKRLLSGGRTDASFNNISFEYKKYKHFDRISGINEALFGRKSTKNDHGLYDYLINSISINAQDNNQDIEAKILKNIGVGFDGNKFIFCRFLKSNDTMNIKKSIEGKLKELELKLEFVYELKDFDLGLRKLALLLKQQDKMELNKNNLLATINPKSSFVRNSIITIYDELNFNLFDLNGSNRIRTLYNEWDRVFGVMYGDDDEATIFTDVSPIIKQIYGIEENQKIDSKLYLFSLQTFFNVFLKLLVHTFLAELISPTFIERQELSKAQIDSLFDGNDMQEKKIINNFFEAHFMEWFTYSDSGFEVDFINDTLELIHNFNLSTFILKPEDVQDILQEVYMELIPADMRHLMGEYFSPDWIVEHALDEVMFYGDINKTLVDPTCGSGSFLINALKRIINKEKTLNKKKIELITNNVVGFDINPISVVAAKANYILTVFSAYFDDVDEDFGDPISIPIYIADSILAPVVYSEENHHTLIIETSVGKFEIPKFDNYKTANEFLKLLSVHIHERPSFEVFWKIAFTKKLVRIKDKEIVQLFFDKLYVLHRSGKDSFWPIILRNSFAPVMIRDKFDYVVGNPPWISWKSMSKSYREGTLDIWISYGIFEKSAYDKKTTHDDFGMAVTYVAIDQYLKIDGSMVFLLPVSFLKSSKGGEGFRRFSIVRNNQNIDFSIDQVDDFSDVNLFTIPTASVKFTKGKKNMYPIETYYKWKQKGGKRKIDSHTKWSEISKKLTKKTFFAQPIDPQNIQSSWLTLQDLTFANLISNAGSQYYKGRKGIEPAGAKGVFVLKKPERKNNMLSIVNDMSRQRRMDILKIGEIPAIIEEDYIYPMLGGRNIERWRVKSSEFMLVPHDSENIYGIPEIILFEKAPKTYEWLNNYRKELLASRIQNGKFFNPDTQPFYRLDNVGIYMYKPYKVLWKEQTGSMSAVVVNTYLQSIPNADPTLFLTDKIIVIDSKVLMLGLDNEKEAYYVCGIINSESVREVIDGYAISTNRGIDILKNIHIQKFDIDNKLHNNISQLSKKIHLIKKEQGDSNISNLEKKLNELIINLYQKTS